MSARVESSPRALATASAAVAVDAEALMMAAIGQLEQVQGQGALGRCRRAHGQRDARVKAAQAAIARAARQRKKGAFWRKLSRTAVTVGKVAAIAAAVAAAPATGGSTLLVAVAVAGATLSVGAAVMRHYKVNADLGDVRLFKHRFDVKLTGLMDTAGMVAMGAATLGASGAGSAASATATSSAARALGAVAAGVQCGSDAASAVSAVRLGQIEAAALRVDAQSVTHRAEAEQAAAEARDQQELWKDIQDSYQRARAALTASTESRYQTLDTIGRVRA